jgi:hypothetical protein
MMLRSSGPANKEASDDEARFENLVAVFIDEPGVSRSESNAGFGSRSLRHRGKIFAMVVQGRLVVKLPEHRVEALVSSGDGVPFDANKGTPMKEWLSLEPGSRVGWTGLAREALSFVSDDPTGVAVSS